MNPHESAPNRTRAEFLQWAKDRAGAYLDRGQVAAGLASFMSDIKQHPEIQPAAIELLFGIEAFAGNLKTAEQARKFINGTN
jgi:hypothetical protein